MQFKLSNLYSKGRPMALAYILESLYYGLEIATP